MITIPNYKKMYLSLFKDISDTIENLKLAQLKAEELYMGGKSTPGNVMPAAPNDGERAAE